MSNPHAIRAGAYELRLALIGSTIPIAIDMINEGNKHGAIHILTVCLRTARLSSPEEHEQEESAEIIPFRSAAE